GAGYLYDYQQTSIPRAHLKVDREWGKLDAAFSVLGEIPLGEDEEEEEAEAQAGVNGLEEEDEEEEGEYDEIDLVLSAGASYQVADWSRLGAEAEMEDMEGFWEDDEAEGGAKLLLGPTATFAFLDNAHARVNVAGIIPLTSNDQTRVPGDQNTNKSGVMARAALGYTFR
ncbi:hypothetical protein KDL45_15225, partial [bacterium]|nr:hypothetical protein [bacterium]